MKVNQDLSILLWLRKQRKDESGKVPVCVRLTINGVRAQFSLGIKVLPSQFNTDSGSVKGKSEESKMINNQLDVVKGQLHLHYNKMIALYNVVTPEMIKNSYLGKVQEQKTLVQAFKYHNEQFEQKGSKSSAKECLILGSGISERLNSAFKKAIILSKVVLNFSRAIRKYLLKNRSNLLKNRNQPFNSFTLFTIRNKSSTTISLDAQSCL
jgi:hypothetical protein